MSPGQARWTPFATSTVTTTFRMSPGRKIAEPAIAAPSGRSMFAASTDAHEVDDDTPPSAVAARAGEHAAAREQARGEPSGRRTRRAPSRRGTPPRARRTRRRRRGCPRAAGGPPPRARAGAAPTARPCASTQDRAGEITPSVWNVIGTAVPPSVDRPGGAERWRMSGEYRDLRQVARRGANAAAPRALRRWTGWRSVAPDGRRGGRRPSRSRDELRGAGSRWPYKNHRTILERCGGRGRGGRQGGAGRLLRGVGCGDVRHDSPRLATSASTSASTYRRGLPT